MTGRVPYYKQSIHNDNDIELLDKIDECVPEELISHRSGGGNKSFAYLVGDIIADQMNRIFGPLAWDARAHEAKISTYNDARKKDGRDIEMKVIVVTTMVELRIKARNSGSDDTIFIQTGTGNGEHEVGRSPKDAVSMAVKGAETDGLKRCASMLGRAFGMLMDPKGNQSDIEYAHKNNNANLKKAQNIRARKEQAKQERKTQEPKSDKPSGNQDGGNAQNDRQVNAKPEPEKKSPEKKSPEKKEPEKSAGKSNDDVESSGKSKAEAPETKKNKRNTRQAKTDFNLDSEPVTREDQIDYGATLIKKLESIDSEDDKRDLVSQHRDTICNLEVSIKRRVEENLSKQGIDINKIQK